jgi:hypothetical protein
MFRSALQHLALKARQQNLRSHIQQTAPMGIEVNRELVGRKDAEFATCRVLGSFEKVIQVIETDIFRAHGKCDPSRNALHERVVETQRELIDRGVIGISSRCKLLERFSWNCGIQ